MFSNEPGIITEPFSGFRQVNSYIRMLHASPGAPAVDIYVNNNPVARALSYRSFTPYLPLPPGNYNLRILPAGTVANPFIDTSINIAPQTITTLAAIGTPPNISLLPVPDTPMPMQPGRVYLRFAHLSPTAPNVDVAIPNGDILFRDVQYREYTGYTITNPGTFTFFLRPTGTNQNVLYVPNIRLMPNRAYTIYAVGLAGSNPPLQVLIPLDGNSYIKF